VGDANAIHAEVPESNRAPCAEIRCIDDADSILPRPISWYEPSSAMIRYVKYEPFTSRVENRNLPGACPSRVIFPAPVEVVVSSIMSNATLYVISAPYPMTAERIDTSVPVTIDSEFSTIFPAAQVVPACAGSDR